MLLADAAQESQGKLYILGGGWSVTSSPTGPMSLAIKFDVPWDRTNIEHDWTLRLLSEDGYLVQIEETPIGVDGQLTVARPDNVPAGTAVDAAVTVSFGPLPLVPGRFEWRLEIDGTTATCPFTVRDSPSLPLN